jgi:hypothetical protein
MAVIWCGGEDSDFTGSFTVDTNTSHFRSTFARCAIVPTGTTMALSNTFAPVSSFWLSFRLFGGLQVGNGLIGMIQASSGKGLFMVQNTDTNTGNIGIYKYDGTTFTLLAKESGATFGNPSNLARIDIQVSNWGASTNVVLYANGVSKITWTGDLSFAGAVTGINCLQLNGTSQPQAFLISEIILATEDTRAWPGLQNLALTGAGTTDQWTGVYSTINQVTLSDTTPNYTNTAGQDQQFNITDLISGVFLIKAVKVTARAAVSASPTPTKIAIGYNSGGTVAVGPAQTVATAYAPIEQLDAINPVTGLAWAQSDMNALQLNLRSAT